MAQQRLFFVGGRNCQQNVFFKGRITACRFRPSDHSVADLAPWFSIGYKGQLDRNARWAAVAGLVQGAPGPDMGGVEDP
jgi:hypothetical protein